MRKNHSGMPRLRVRYIAITPRGTRTTKMPALRAKLTPKFDSCETIPEPIET